MKFIFNCLGIFLVLNVVCGETPYDNEMAECATELGIDTLEETVALIAAEDKKVECIHECFFKKLGAVNDDKLDKEKLIAILDEKKDTYLQYPEMIEALPGCYDEATKDEGTICEVTTKFSKCMKGHLKKE